ncbi:MAG: hypothetical protein JXL84_15010 [Deltaproteobacteria bacterium]|nr:hypothetical protein [Deltaproteobacteria bacterium]
MKTKVCAKCGLEKPVEEFNRHKLYKDGLDRQCKSCKAEYARHYWQRRKGKKEEEKAEPGKREVETGKRAAEGGSGNGIFDWGKVEELLTGQRVTRERVRAVAEDQVRTVEEEMAFLLVRGLKTDEMKLKARDGSIL